MLAGSGGVSAGMVRWQAGDTVVFAKDSFSGLNIRLDLTVTRESELKTMPTVIRMARSKSAICFI